MPSQLAHRFANHHEISSERLEAVAMDLNRKLVRESEEKRAVSLVACKTISIVAETSSVREAELEQKICTSRRQTVADSLEWHGPVRWRCHVSGNLLDASSRLGACLVRRCEIGQAID